MSGGTAHVNHAHMGYDATCWDKAAGHVVTAKNKARSLAQDAPKFGSFIGLKTAWTDDVVEPIASYLEAGAGSLAKVSSLLTLNNTTSENTDSQSQQTIKQAAGRNGGGGAEGENSDSGGKYKGKLEGTVDDVVPNEPDPPKPPKDAQTYDRLEALVNGMLEEDGVRFNALDTNDPFDQSQETVVAYTDADGKVHVISTNPNQGIQATDLTVSFLSEDGTMHVITSVDSQMVEATTAPNGVVERRVIAQGSLDQMMAEAKEVSISYTDAEGAEHVVSTDQSQGGQMRQVVLAYADEDGQQHMVSNEKGIDASPKDSPANQNMAFSSGGLTSPTLQPMNQPSA